MPSNWTNQYIGLLDTKPEYVIQLPTGLIEARDKPLFETRLASFPRLFCEIGSGSGGHLIEIAARNPDALCIGIELRFKRAYRTAEKAEAQGLRNVLVLRGNGGRIFEILPAGSVERLYINFPDPWDKRTWKRRRILSVDFFARLPALLGPRGHLSYKTDHREYFDETLKIAADSPAFRVSKMSYDLAASEYEGGNVATEFERLFRSKGQPIYFAEFERCDARAA